MPALVASSSSHLVRVARRSRAAADASRVGVARASTPRGSIRVRPSAASRTIVVVAEKRSGSDAPRVRSSAPRAPPPARRRRRRRAVVAAAAAPPAIAAGMTALQFTPVDALAGGAILGVAAIAKLTLTGRVLGVSGAVEGCVGAKTTTTTTTPAGDVAFVAGLLAAGCAAAFGLMGGVAPSPEPMVPIARAAAAGFLVGLGAAMGNGCTSGHGICGNARLSPRSMANTCVFMFTGFLAATLFDTNAALGVVSNVSATANPAYPAFAAARGWIAFAGVAVAAFAALASAATAKGGVRGGGTTIGVIADGAVGYVFGAGLLVSGMTRPTKVSGFLSATAASFDPSLMLVMCGALALCVPGFYLVRKLRDSPACAEGFDVPSGKTIDAKLMTGGALFGAGWGLGGVCPGPAIVALAATPNAAIATWIVAMLAGMLVNKSVFSSQA